MLNPKPKVPVRSLGYNPELLGGEEGMWFSLQKPSPERTTQSTFHFFVSYLLHSLKQGLYRGLHGVPGLGSKLLEGVI